jgi:copper chaperone CopZ
MKKNVKLIDLDCANCAAKIEEAVKKMEGVQSCSVNFMAQKMVLEAADDKFNEVFAQVKKLILKLEPDVTVEI